MESPEIRIHPEYLRQLIINEITNCNHDGLKKLLTQYNVKEVVKNQENNVLITGLLETLEEYIEEDDKKIAMTGKGELNQLNRRDILETIKVTKKIIALSSNVLQA